MFNGTSKVVNQVKGELFGYGVFSILIFSTNAIILWYSLRARAKLTVNISDTADDATKKQAAETVCLLVTVQMFYGFVLMSWFLWLMQAGLSRLKTQAGNVCVSLNETDYTAMGYAQIINPLACLTSALNPAINIWRNQKLNSWLMGMFRSRQEEQTSATTTESAIA
eukprot:sb/3472440/